MLKVLADKGLKPTAIINTHAHADHCGANSYVKKRTGAMVYAPEIEADLIQHPLLEPLAFFSFASPPDEMKSKFMMAKPSPVDQVIDSQEHILNINGINIRVLPLPGHSINQIGLIYDGIMFCADSVLSREILAKHRLPLNFDVEKQMETLHALQASRYKFYIPSHAEPTPDVADLVTANLEAIKGIEDYISNLVQESIPVDDIVQKLCDAYKLDLNTSPQYYLARSTVMSYLTSLCKQGRIKQIIKSNRLLWVKLT